MEVTAVDKEVQSVFCIGPVGCGKEILAGKIRKEDGHHLILMSDFLARYFDCTESLARTTDRLINDLFDEVLAGFGKKDVVCTDYPATMSQLMHGVDPVFRRRDARVIVFENVSDYACYQRLASGGVVDNHAFYSLLRMYHMEMEKIGPTLGMPLFHDRVLRVDGRKSAEEIFAETHHFLRIPIVRPARATVKEMVSVQSV